VIAPGDLVLVRRRGRLFYARVTGGVIAGRVAVAPLERHVRDRSARVDDVVEQWSRAGSAVTAGPARGQLRLGGWER
jgi:hypothetical protein